MKVRRGGGLEYTDQGTTPLLALADALAEEFLISKENARRVLMFVFNLIAMELKEGRRVKVTGFGTFKVMWHRGRAVSNNRKLNGRDTDNRVDPHFHAHFWMGKTLRNYLNEEVQDDGATVVGELYPLVRRQAEGADGGGQGPGDEEVPQGG